LGQPISPYQQIHLQQQLVTQAILAHLRYHVNPVLLFAQAGHDVHTKPSLNERWLEPNKTILEAGEVVGEWFIF
jgi:hypothetical protein